MRKRIVLCADDYGQAPAISRGIVALVEKHRLSAVSCMTTTPHWPEHAKWLHPFHSQIDIGLHLNLTDGSTSLPNLMFKALSRQLNLAAVTTEFQRQVDAFEQNMGFLPQFLDGHQHIHQFPIIREALIQVYKKRFPRKNVYVRLTSTDMTVSDIAKNVKKAIVYLMGANALKTLLLEHQIPHNSSFSGMYTFGQAAEYRRLFPHFLAESQDKGLIMCHPGWLQSVGQDPIAKARYAEYEYLASEQFLQDCEASQTLIDRFEL